MSRGRLNSGNVKVGEDEFILSWQTREELLRWVGGVPAGGERTVERFTAVGATRPVELSLADEGAVLLALEQWKKVAGDAGLPPDAAALRAALEDANRRRHRGR